MSNRMENQRGRRSAGGDDRASGRHLANEGTASFAAPAIISFLNGQCTPAATRQELLRGLFSLHSDNRSPGRT